MTMNDVHAILEVIGCFTVGAILFLGAIELLDRVIS